MFENINLWAVLVATIANILIGSFWYGPLFGKTWMRLEGITKSDISKAQKRGMTQSYIFMIISSLISAFLLAYFIGFGTGIAEGVLTAFLIWLGFIATSQISEVLWQAKPWSLYVLKIAYYLVTFVVQALIISAWV